jgi:hypothetical protein
MEIEEVKEMIAEALKPHQETLATLEQRNTALEGELKGFKEQAEADKKAQVYESFQTKLKPGHQEKAKELFAAYQADPARWAMENADKFVQARETRGLQGRAITEDAQGGFNLEAERAKLKAEGKVI